MAIKHKNFAQTTLGAAITTTDGTSITVTSEASFPAVDFIISIDTEAMLVTNVSTTTWTVTRGYEGSTAATHLNGAAIYHDWSAAEADSTVHGPASVTTNHIAQYDGTTGKLLKDGGVLGTMAAQATGSYTPNSTYDAQTLLVALTDNSPTALSISEQTVLGRKSGGDITALGASDILSVLGVTASVAELNHVDGVTSAIQTQLNNKGEAHIAVHQHTHGLAVGDVVYCSGANAYAKAKADAAATADVVGVVSSSAGVDDFVICAGGKMTTGVPAVAAGSVLFLSDTTAGALTTTEPTAAGHISLPIAVVTENAVSMIVYSWRGMEIGTAGSGDVIGPASATDGNLAVFNGVSGKIIKDGGAVTAAGLALIDDANAAAQLTTLGAAAAADVSAKLAKAGDTMTGNLIMDNMDITLVKLLTLHGEIDDGNSSTADTIDWNTGAAHKSTLTGNVTFAFAGSTYAVPDMTSNTAPSGAASDSDAAAQAWYLFNQNDDNGKVYTVGEWIQYDFGVGNGATASSYNIKCLDGGYDIAAWKIQGSNNGTDFTDLDVVAGHATAALTNFIIDTPAFYRIYRILVVTVGSQGSAVIYRFEPLTGVSNPAAPCFLTLKLVQDGTGGRTVTWPATVKGTPAINLAANAVSNVFFYWDGTNYWTLNGKQFVSATDKVLGRSTAGAGEVEEIACTAAGRAILDDANAAAQLVTLGAVPLAGGTMSGDITLGENTALALDPSASADEKWSGITVSGTAGATLAVGDLCYLNSSWKWVLADADTAAGAGSVALGLCILAAAGDTSATNMLLLGTMRSAAFPASITGGAQLYVSQTAGDMTTTMPTGADVVVRVCGWAILTEPNTIYFAPSSDFITRVS